MSSFFVKSLLSFSIRECVLEILERLLNVDLYFLSVHRFWRLSFFIQMRYKKTMMMFAFERFEIVTTKRLHWFQKNRKSKKRNYIFWHLHEIIEPVIIRSKIFNKSISLSWKLNIEFLHFSCTFCMLIEVRISKYRLFNENTFVSFIKFANQNWLFDNRLSFHIFIYFCIRHDDDDEKISNRYESFNLTNDDDDSCNFIFKLFIRIVLKCSWLSSVH